MSKKRTKTEERTERRISAVTSLSMCAMTVIAQIAITLLVTRLLEESANVVYFLRLAGAVVAIRVYQRPGSPSYKLVWMCLLLALPVSGMILFWLWGGTHQAKSLSLRKIAASAGAGESADGERCQCVPAESPVTGLGAFGGLSAKAGILALPQYPSPLFWRWRRFF
ncbi:MAG: PLD nuclease N-terminal domain-containing protein [Dysosmobacter sp.]